MSGLIVTGEAEPYGEPRTFAQKMKNRFGSKALPRPMSGPHLRWDEHRAGGRMSLCAPIFDIGAAGECVADDHDIVFRLVQGAPRLVGHGDVDERVPRVESEGRDGEDVLRVDEAGERHVVRKRARLVG